MKDKQLFQETFSSIHASQTLKTEVLNMQQKKSPRGILRAALIAAVIVVLSVTTVLAATQLGRSRVETDDYVSYTPTDPSGNSWAIQTHKLYLDMEFSAEAPKSIEEFYLPQVPEDYIQVWGYLYKDNMVAQYFWKEPEVSQGSISFFQWAGGSVDRTDLEETLFTEPEAPAPQIQEITLAGIDGFGVDLEAVLDEPGQRLFFWSDGQYLFRLQAPGSYTDAQLEALIKSVQPVEDIRPWLIEMTEAEIQAALD